jgi:beta-lactamase class A
MTPLDLANNCDHTMRLLIISLLLVAAISCARQIPPNEPAPPTDGAITTSQTSKLDDGTLTARLQEISARANGEVGIAVTHVESGRGVNFNGSTRLRLYSVFKLPLAVAVLKKVEAKTLSLDQVVKIDAEDVTPGWKGNTDLWAKPADKTVRELLEMSLVRSDNTSSDKLLQLVGGPAGLTETMRSLGLQHIDIVTTVKDFVLNRTKPNTGTAADLAELLARLQRGEILKPSELSLLRGWMEKSTTGLKRLRGDLPPGTIVADKTGTGDAGSNTNDVGLITLPNSRGNLAIAVLVSGSKLTPEEQEKVIAEIARAAFDAYIKSEPPAVAGGL